MLPILGHFNAARLGANDGASVCGKAGGDKEAAREVIHGMPSGEWKERFQSPATEEQLARMAVSVAKNAQE